MKHKCEFLLHLSPANWVATKNASTLENNLSVQNIEWTNLLVAAGCRVPNGLWSTFLGQNLSKHSEENYTAEEIFHLF